MCFLVIFALNSVRDDTKEEKKVEKPLSLMVRLKCEVHCQKLSSASDSCDLSQIIFDDFKVKQK